MAFTNSNGVNFSYSPIFIISPGNLGGSASNESPHINTYEASLQQSSPRSNSLQFSENQKRILTVPQLQGILTRQAHHQILSISQNSNNKNEIKTKKEPKEDSVNPSII